MEIHLPGPGAVNSSECLAYEHQQRIWTSAPTPTAAYMQHLVDSMNGNSPAGDGADPGVAAQAAPDLIHQLYEWIGGTSCSLQGTQITRRVNVTHLKDCIHQLVWGPMCGTLAGLSSFWLVQSSMDDVLWVVADHLLLQDLTGTRSHQIRRRQSACSMTHGQAWYSRNRCGCLLSVSNHVQQCTACVQE